MADALRNARLAFVKVGSDVYSAETGSSLSITADLIETTNKSDTASASFIHDIYRGTAAAASLIKMDDTDGGIETLASLFLTNIIAGTEATLIYVLQASSPTTTITASALVTSWDVNADQGGVTTHNAAFQLTGAITVVETST